LIIFIDVIIEIGNILMVGMLTNARILMEGWGTVNTTWRDIWGK
jgi:hypothetical protein